MSAFTRYAALVERNSSVNRKAPSDQLVEAHEMFGYTFPFSGDMLAVLKEDTRTRQYHRHLAVSWSRQEGEL